MILDKKIPFAYIFNKIKKDLIFVLCVGLVFNLLTAQFSSYLPDMPLAVATFLGTAISVLLSFKISQSYDRWWEARTVWGGIVNDSRNIVLQLQHFVADNNSAAIQRVAYRQIAWCYALGQALRGKNPLANLEQYLPAEELAAVALHINKPLALLQRNMQDIKTLRKEGHIHIFGQVQLDSTLVRLCDSMGKTERINSTVFPVTYRLFLHFAIYLFVIILSIALRNVSFVFELPLLILLSSIFFLLEKTAYYLQDPFTDRPTDISVTAIARNIEINIRQLLEEKEVPEPIAPEGFYLM